MIGTDEIVRVLCFDWCCQRVECIVRDGNIIRRIMGSHE